jgi:demethylmenaquinone methyltransferase / 2-methoxy-6-polyprenyl-1,4-benzoquinol methylase
MSTAVNSMFDAIAGRYDGLNHALSMGRDRAWRRKAVALLPPLDKKARVLDLCGGTGDFSLALRRGEIEVDCAVGDFSLPMLKLGRNKGLSGLAVLDALKPPFRAGTFDIVLCGFGMRNLDSLEDGVRLVHELLKPGGVFLTLEFFRPGTAFTRFFYRGLAPLFIPFLGRALGSNREAYEYLVSSVQNFRSAEEYACLCRAIGFDRVRTVSCDFDIANVVLAVKGNGRE